MEALAQLDQDDALADGERDFNSLEFALERDRLKESLHAFVVEAWPIVEPDQPFVDNWHIRELCDVLELVTRGKLRRVVVNVPPGTMKSLLISVMWPCWTWARDKRKRFLMAAYGAHLTTRDNVRARDILTSSWYQKYFPFEFAEDQNNKTRYNTDKGGWRLATSVGGPGTGEHPDIVVIDDALTAQQAESEPERTTANNWFDRTMSTRGVSRNVAVVCVGQRLHEEDLPGYLLKREGWTHVCFPMRFESTRPKTETDPGHQADPRDHRTANGELLWPAVFDEPKVRQLELDLGPYGTAGQLQQRPAPEGGGLFKREWFKFTAVPPAMARRARGWDTAGTENAGDYTAGARVAEEFARVPVTASTTKLASTGRFIVEDVRRDRLSPAGVDALFLSTATLDGKGCAQREEKEGGASGKAVVDARAKLLKGYDYSPVQISGNKVTRVKPFRSQCEAGNVYLLKTGDPNQDRWIEPFIAELCAFPTAKHDDQVDAVGCAFNAVLLEPAPYKVKATW